MVGNAAGSTFVAGTGDLVGSADNPISRASVIELELADNGGSTPTHALVPSGPAIDAGGSNDTENHTIRQRDQRGRPRPVDGNGVPRVDIGAVEFSVANVGDGPLIVASLVPTSTGFVAEFNSELDSESLNQFTAQPSVLLKGATVGEVSGSLVVDSSLRKVTFIKTGGPLAADNYTITLRSDVDSFKELAGDILDGDGDGAAGGDFIETFLVEEIAASTVTVGLSDFVRGPGQQVDVPANTARGLPLSISNGLGVRSGVIEIEFNPAYLNITGATLGTAMPADSTVTFDGSVAGRALVAFSSFDGLPAEEIIPLELQASVPSQHDIRGAQHVLEIRSAVIGTDPHARVQVVADSAVHVVSYLGDVSVNARINAGDAADLARVAALLDRGFAALPNTDPAIVGDISGNGRLNAADASLVAQFAALIDVPQIPAIPGGVVIAGLADLGPGLPGFVINLPSHDGHTVSPAADQPGQSSIDARWTLTDLPYPAIDRAIEQLSDSPTPGTADWLNLPLEAAIDELLSSGTLFA